MDNQQQRIAMPKNIWVILIWLGFLVFFIYSYHSIIDLEGLSDPRRQTSFIRILTRLSQPSLSDNEVTNQVIVKMLETIQIAFLATSISAVLAIPFTFLMNKNSSTWIRLINIFLHPTLAVIRAVHPIIILIITFPLVGIGHTSSMLALIFFSIAILIEKFIEYKRAYSDLSRISLITVYFPAVAFRFLPKNSVNTVVLGFFGLSGIGDFFEYRVLLLEYQDASVALLAMIISIGSIDLLSQIVWNKVHKPTKEALA